MSITFALDELYATGWSTLDTAGCELGDDGRWFPSAESIEREFAAAGFELAVTHVQLFDCYRAEWRTRGGEVAGAVVGQTRAEAAIYALSQMRRSLIPSA